jgi:hypothetical protein
LATVAGPSDARQGSRFARPAPPADGLDRRRLAPAFVGHALMAQRERYAAPRFNGLGVADKFAPFSGKSLCAAEAPWLIIENLDQNKRDRWGRYQTISTTICAPLFDEQARPAKKKRSEWTVTDDWPDEVPITEAEIEVFEAWFADLFDELFATRH